MGFMQNDNRNLLIIFAKGKGEKVKTRLAQDLGSMNASKIYYFLVELLMHSIDQVDKNYDILFFIQGDNRYYQEKFPSIPVKSQNEGSLGDKIDQAFSLGFKEYESVIIIGTDCPDLSVDEINHAFGRLTKFDVVIGPAEDGGYYLLGMNQKINIWDSVSWSESVVFEQTIHLIQGKNLTYNTLAKKRDIDTKVDLEYYINHLFLELPPNLLA
jgi:rSAM/selenodomain-associated transferase 1